MNKQAAKHNRIIKVLLQIYVAAEDTKFGMNEEECNQLLANFKQSTFNHVNIAGVMGMASNTDNKTQIANEFARLFQYFNTLKSTFFASDTSFCYCSMGMSSDYEIAMAQGSNMVRIGSLLFGNR
ncbi:MAG: hypothetical protein EBX41_10750 [Chitinophagia bacterium]|nr:hypothetical protein [Chitinophagia bacterium]